MDALLAGEQERETDRVGDVAGVGRRELRVGLGHGPTIARSGEQIKNPTLGRSCEDAKKAPHELGGSEAGPEAERLGLGQESKRAALPQREPSRVVPHRRLSLAPRGACRRLVRRRGARSMLCRHCASDLAVRQLSVWHYAPLGRVSSA
jgi:hypothetical protein